MLCVVLSAALAAPAQAPDPNLFGKLLKEGLAVPGGPAVRLPAPYVSHGTPAAKKKKVLDDLADEAGLNFLENNVNAPIYIKTTPIGNGGRQRGYTISVAFVAYGKLKQLEKGNLINELMGLKRKEKEEKARQPILLTEADLTARKIVPLPKGVGEERYAVLDALLIEKVKLTGVMRNQTRHEKGQVTAVAVLDDRFANDKEHPNRYLVLETEVKKPYTGFGGYARATELDDPAGALFIEMHFVYSEPADWFNGKSILVPKLRIVIPDNVKSMRRSLKAGK